MTSPDVIFNCRYTYALNHNDNRLSKKSKDSVNKKIVGMFDYYSNEEKRVMTMFDYYTGDLNKKETMNLVKEEGKYATAKDIEIRKNLYKKYINDSNLWQGVISFNNDFIDSHIELKELEQRLIKQVIPKFFSECGFKDIKNMSYQIALHSDTDIYPLFNNILANIINNEEDMLLHSAVLCYNNIGFLVLGDFNHGKTTLCLEASKFNFKILSADQSIIQIKNNHIFLTNGSKYLRVRGEDDLIINEAFGDIEIKYILNLIGLCEYGKATFELITDYNYKIKTLFKYLTWHSDIPLFTDNSLLNVDRVLIKEWLGKINIPVYNVRGNNIEIINIMKELK